MRRCINGKPKITSRHGQPTNAGFFKRHLGYDYSTPVGTPVYASEAGKITGVGISKSVGKYVYLEGKYTHRYFHLSSQGVKSGQKVKEGQLIAKSGNTGTNTTGPHIHEDTRKNGTAWNASFSNYVDWEKLIAVKPPAPKYVTVQPGWGLSNIAKAAGYKDWFAPTAWIRLAQKNGYGLNWPKFNASLKPKQKVKV